MKKAALFACLLFASTFLSASSLWSPVVDKLKQSVVFVEIADENGAPQGSCSGFMIDSKKHHVLTAGHCDGPKVTVDGTPTIKIFKDERKDLMVIRAYSVERPALKLAPKGPDVGDEVASMGFGFGLEQPMFRVAHISNIRLDIEGLSGPFIVIDAAFVGGQSGGPVVNQTGEVIGIVQRGGEGVGLGVGAEVIKDRVGRFFGEDK